MYKIKNTRLKLESRISHLHKIFYSAYIVEPFWNIEGSKRVLLSYQYRQRTPNKRYCQAKILNLSGNRIASCWAVCPQFCTGWIHFFWILRPSKSVPACSCDRCGGCPIRVRPFLMAVHFSLQGTVKQILQQRCQYSILAGKRDTGLQLFNAFALNCSKSNELLIIKVCL